MFDMSIQNQGNSQSDLTDTLSSLGPQDLNESQLEVFKSKEQLKSRLSYSINMTESLEAIRRMEDQHIIALSAGGSKLIRGDFVVKNGVLELINEIQTIKEGHLGEGYFEHLISIGQEAKEKNIPVGMAYAATINSDTREILEDANLGKLREAIKQQLQGNIKNGIPTLQSFGNDSVMGIIAGMTKAKNRNSQIAEGINFINGTGTGVAIYTEQNGMGKIYSVEPEYRPVIEELFPVKKYRDGKADVQEIISGSGIENIYFYVTQNHLDGPSISKLAQDGNSLALKLYAQSAYIGAHVIVGVGKGAFGLFANPSNIAIILEGSLCDNARVPGYSDLLIKTVEKNIGGCPTVVFPEDQIPFSLLGAAISAVKYG
jgi:hypothetical protein